MVTWGNPEFSGFWRKYTKILRKIEYFVQKSKNSFEIAKNSFENQRKAVGIAPITLKHASWHAIQQSGQARVRDLGGFLLERPLGTPVSKVSKVSKLRLRGGGGLWPSWASQSIQSSQPFQAGRAKMRSGTSPGPRHTNKHANREDVGCKPCTTNR